LPIPLESLAHRQRLPRVIYMNIALFVLHWMSRRLISCLPFFTPRIPVATESWQGDLELYFWEMVIVGCES
jgi:hypothetical protein